MYEHIFPVKKIHHTQKKKNKLYMINFIKYTLNKVFFLALLHLQTFVRIKFAQTPLEALEIAQFIIIRPMTTRAKGCEFCPCIQKCFCLMD